MTNPTSNFGWQMPTSTDLVTDLPADFETFGQAVDTSLADLKGGTTGQVLSKASNTDMDFTWVAQDDSNAIQNAIVDAKGDLIAASAADTPARLAVGANDTLLIADSTAATGLKWGGGWTTYTPSNTNITVGNGTQTARYAKIGKTVFLSYKLTWGSTTSFGGNILVGLPSTCNSFSAGVGILTDSGASNYTANLFTNAGENFVRVIGNYVTGNYTRADNAVNATTPYTFTTNDVVQFFFTYEEA